VKRVSALETQCSVKNASSCTRTTYPPCVYRFFCLILYFALLGDPSGLQLLRGGSDAIHHLQEDMQ
jgi:hypothetical protein